MQLKYVSALPRSACSAHTHYTKEYRIMVFVRDGVKFHLLFVVATAARSTCTNTLQLQSTFSYFTLFALRARDILLCAALSLFVCVPRFAARVITACRNKLANTNINRELRKRVVVSPTTTTRSLAYFSGDDGRKKLAAANNPPRTHSFATN